MMENVGVYEIITENGGLYRAYITLSLECGATLEIFYIDENGGRHLEKLTHYRTKYYATVAMRRYKKGEWKQIKKGR